MTLRARDFGLICDTLEPGRWNAITDVPGVLVGHHGLRCGAVNTGVTAIKPHAGNLYRRKVLAASDVINGFGKSVGLVQIDELGSLETPILLTNTFGVSACAEALIRTAISANHDIGRETATVNPVVGECNDGPLNDIQAMTIRAEHAIAALDAAADGAVAEGNVGAGVGMTCFGFKGGIGTASRLVRLGNGVHHMGVLVLSNFGRSGDLILPDGRRPKPEKRTVLAADSGVEKGSIIIVMATDVPLDHRQLSRVTRRCGAGLARLGSFWGNGSGDIAIGFSTATIFDHDACGDFLSFRMLNEARIDRLFQAAAEATQEAILNSLCAATAMQGRAGEYRASLADWLRLHHAA